MRVLDPNLQRRYTFTSEAVLSYAELRLRYDFTNLRNAIAVVVRAERNLPPTAQVEIDHVLLFAFALTVAPSLVLEWKNALEKKVTLFADFPLSSFTIRARSNLQIVIKDNTVVAVKRS